MATKPMTTEELFDKICGILKEKGTLPDILDYGLATSNPVSIRTYQFDLKNNLAYGGSEGISSLRKILMSMRIWMPLPGRVQMSIQPMKREKIRSLELELSERGYSLDYINIIYVGGGALMAGIGAVNVPAKQEETSPMETELPEVCGELLEELSGVLDLIG